jgi:hypothetical protein
MRSNVVQRQYSMIGQEKGDRMDRFDCTLEGFCKHHIDQSEAMISIDKQICLRWKQMDLMCVQV